MFATLAPRSLRPVWRPVLAVLDPAQSEHSTRYEDINSLKL